MRAISPHSMSDSHQDVSSLVRAIERLSIAIEGSNSARREQGGWEVISPRAGPANPSISDLRQRQDRVEFGDYESFAELLPPCPERLQGLCSRLSGGNYSSEYRAKRAWEAGYWASLCQRKRIRVPRASLPFDLRPAVYIIIQAPGLQSPTRVARASDLARITKRFTEDVICHGFASLAEAEVYCASYGIPLPCPHQFQP